MKKTIIQDLASTNIDSDNIKEYKNLPVFIFSRINYLKTLNVYRDNIIGRSSSNNPNEFKETMTYLYPEFKSDILYSINETMIESGVHYLFEDIFQKYYRNNHHMAAQLLLKLLRENYNHIRVVKAILHIVSHYTYEEIGEDFLFASSSLLQHENKTIRKFAIKLFDNWDSIETLHILQCTKVMKEKWLEDYKNRIIERLIKKEDNNAIFFTCN